MNDPLVEKIAAALAEEVVDLHPSILDRVAMVAARVARDNRGNVLLPNREGLIGCRPQTTEPPKPGLSVVRDEPADDVSEGNP